MKTLIAAAILLAAGGAGCGYRVGGQGALMPATVKTIAIPAFGNATMRYRLARVLPEEISRELLSRTHYAVIADSSRADAVLTGSVANFAAYGTIIDPVTSRASSNKVTVTLNLKLTERRTGKVLYSRAGADFTERYEIALDLSQYFDESDTAMDRVARDVARSVVSGILEAF